MTTLLIGMKEFRQNLAKFTNQSRKKNIRYIVLRKNVPVLEIRPIDEKKVALEQLMENLEKAENEIKEGKKYTQKEIMNEFGLL